MSARELAVVETDLTRARNAIELADEVQGLVVRMR